VHGAVAVRDPRSMALSVLAALICAVGAAWSAGAQAMPVEDAVVEPVSDTVAGMAAWIATSHDNGGLPFIVIDKVAAAVFVFDADGRLLGNAPALLGLAHGDDSAPGVGD